MYLGTEGSQKPSRKTAKTRMEKGGTAIRTWAASQKGRRR